MLLIYVLLVTAQAFNDSNTETDPATGRQIVGYAMADELIYTGMLCADFDGDDDDQMTVSLRQSATALLRWATNTSGVLTSDVVKVASVSCAGQRTWDAVWDDLDSTAYEGRRAWRPSREHPLVRWSVSITPARCVLSALLQSGLRSLSESVTDGVSVLDEKFDGWRYSNNTFDAILASLSNYSSPDRWPDLQLGLANGSIRIGHTWRPTHVRRLQPIAAPETLPCSRLYVRDFCASLRQPAEFPVCASDGCSAGFLARLGITREGFTPKHSSRNREHVGPPTLEAAARVTHLGYSLKLSQWQTNEVVSVYMIRGHLTMWGVDCYDYASRDTVRIAVLMAIRKLTVLYGLSLPVDSVAIGLPECRPLTVTFSISLREEWLHNFVAEDLAVSSTHALLALQAILDTELRESCGVVPSRFVHWLLSDVSLGSRQSMMRAGVPCVQSSHVVSTARAMAVSLAETEQGTLRLRYVWLVAAVVGLLLPELIERLAKCRPGDPAR